MGAKFLLPEGLQGKITTAREELFFLHINFAGSAIKTISHDQTGRTIRLKKPMAEAGADCVGTQQPSGGVFYGCKFLNAAIGPTIANTKCNQAFETCKHRFLKQNES